MYTIIYFVIIIIIFVVIYVIVNHITILLFNKGKKEFKLKKSSIYRLAHNYTYGAVVNSSTTNYISDGDLNCSTNDGNLIECEIDEFNELGKDAKCVQCKQISARCINIKNNIYSSTNPNVIVIKPNTSKSKGYCLPSSTISNSCTRRNGGKLILTQSTDTDAVMSSSSLGGVATNSSIIDKHLIYRFVCLCSTPNFFQNDILNANDCTKFVGCRNGTLDNNIHWDSYEDMRCLCSPDKYEQKIGTANTPPTCTLLNVYRRQYNDVTLQAPFEILDKKYIDDNYLKMIDIDRISLPNPCTFDITTKTFVKNVGRIVFDASKKIAYCESLNSNYKTIVINDDYLRGNGGKYANALFRYRIRDVSESNDDSDDNYNMYDNATVYEVYRKGTQIENLPGVRLPYSNFPIYLPYLERDSYNMGNQTGRKYTLYPTIPLNRHKYAMVYVFDANIPDINNIKVVLGQSLKYIPSFMSLNIDTRYRVYNGAIPCVNVSDLASTSSRHIYWIMYPIPPATGFGNKLGREGIMGELVYPDVNSDKFTSTYGFSMVYNGVVEPYTLLFTGTIFTYTINKKIYTRPVSCGDQILTSKYRQNYDKDWSSKRPHVYERLSNGPLQFALTGRDGHLFTRNSYDIEQNEIGTTKKKISRYDFKDGKIIFKKFYS